VFNVTKDKLATLSSVCPRKFVRLPNPKMPIKSKDAHQIQRCPSNPKMPINAHQIQRCPSNPRMPIKSKDAQLA